MGVRNRPARFRFFILPRHFFQYGWLRSILELRNERRTTGAALYDTASIFVPQAILSLATRACDVQHVAEHTARETQPQRKRPFHVTIITLAVLTLWLRFCRVGDLRTFAATFVAQTRSRKRR